MNLRFKIWDVKLPLATLLYSGFPLMPYIICSLFTSVICRLIWARLVHLAFCTFTPTAASFAALSALSFPSTLLWPGIDLIEISCPCWTNRCASDRSAY